MKTLDRYLAGFFIRNLGLSIFSMSALFLFQALFQDLYDHNFPINQIVVYHLLGIPKVMVEISPPAVLLATVLTFSGLARTQELIACFAIGRGLNRLLAVVIGVVLLVSGLILFMQDQVLPPVFRARTNYYWREMKRSPDFFLDIKRDKIWYRSKNMIYNLQRFDNLSKMIFGMSVYTFDDNFNLVQAISAEKGQYSDKGWKLFKGTVTVFSKEDPFPLTQDFQEKEILIPETPKEFQEIEREVDGLHLKELYQYILRMKYAGADTKTYEVKFHSRISLGFIPIVMCILAVPFSTGTRREGGLAKDLGLCLLFTFLYWLFYSIGLSLGTNGALPPWLAAWLPSTIFGVLAAALLARKK